MSAYPNINYCWGSLMVEELIRNGIEYFCIAPGSRSSPLAVCIARHAKAKVMVHFDERGLAFHALGYVTAAKKPAVLVCTSGTAVPNFLPAVVEASKKKVPLIVLTADRPAELRQTGAVQTIDQPGIFGKYVVWQTDLPCPDKAIKPQFVLTTIDQALYQAQRNKGVAHINCMFRDPLAPIEVKENWTQYLSGIQTWQRKGAPYTHYCREVKSGQIDGARDIAQQIEGIKNGVIVSGRLKSASERTAVLGLSKRLGWPIFADISSGLRLGCTDAQIIPYFDQALLAPNIPVDGIIHFGGRMTSKRYYALIERQNLRAYVMVLDHGLRNDPTHQVSVRVEAGAEQFCRSISRYLKKRAPSKLLSALQKSNQRLDLAIERFFKAEESLSEPLVSRLVSQLIPKGTGLFLSNSMPIRDMDMYADFKGAAVEVAGNRGASGIDGIIASAAGYAQGLRKPVTVMVGDLAALHDLNSLAILKGIAVPVVFIVLNNGGGGIFSFLPIARQEDVFEQLFGTPHPFTFANAAAMFELNYVQPQDAKQFTQAYSKALKSPTATIIEIITSRQSNLKLHKALEEQLK